jgi:hypothetical protein
VERCRLRNVQEQFSSDISLSVEFQDEAQDGEDGEGTNSTSGLNRCSQEQHDGHGDECPGGASDDFHSPGLHLGSP